MCDILLDKANIVSILTEHRRALHRLAELSGEESRTHDYVKEKLIKLGLKPYSIGFGLYVDIKGHSRDFIAFRADMDALPIVETPKSFASETEDVSHACGHDGHMAALLTLAELLTRERPPVSVRLIFQPSEERSGGAEGMIQGGALDKIRLIFGMHVDPSLPEGTVATVDGGFFAGTVDFQIDFEGFGAHVADQKLARDPLSAAIAAYKELQSVFREKFADSCLFGVCSMHAGTAHNIIPSTAMMKGAFRYYDDSKKEEFVMTMERILIDITNARAIEHRFTPLAVYPPLINTAKLTETVMRELKMTMTSPRYTAEDFAEYLHYVDGMYYCLGIGTPDFRAPLHSSEFDFNESALYYGIETNMNILRLVGEGKI